MDRPTLLSALSTLTVGVVVPVGLICAFTYLKTFISYQLDVRNRPSCEGDIQITRTPPLIPYAIPGLGSTIGFSNQSVGSFWAFLRTQTDRYRREAFSIILAGKRTHFVFSDDGVSALFKSRQLSRAELDRQLAVNVLGMCKEDSSKAFPDRNNEEKITTERLHSEHLLSSAAVNILTEKFVETFRAQLDEDVGLTDGLDVNLYEWLWHRVFHASTTSLVGSKLLEMYPDFDVDYRVWEDNLLTLLFGTPRLFAREAYRARDACVEKLEKWLQTGYQHPMQDGENPDWTPYSGARIMRRRHELYKQRGLSIHGQAGWDLIFLAGILSNATPATGWMLLHILSPSSSPDFRSRIMQELQSCKRDDGSVNIPALVRLPLLNSAFHEVLRLYVDLLVVRQVDSSVALGTHYVKQGEQVMAPTWMTHRNPAFFNRPDVFDPERFLVTDPETGMLSYSATGLGGKYFPFGGGHYMCPGRVFAKQEVLGTVAMLLLNFDITFRGFVKHTKGSWAAAGKNDFPKIKNGFAGNQVVGIEGYMQVHIKRRPSVSPEDSM